ncbi:SDR family NAD(P)-dependent oxidoreductase [Brevibacillus sp. SYSU BS000544]|uniref:SDR family NAD(P)-dependent oxidoreductase n=1 Tax=Brevibacillus sp. SYSU BS000544 TaxID=3416443 RepID=UPI003CE5474D
MQNHVAIITGSTRGIGLAIAELFAHSGVNVVINGTNEEKVNEVVKRLNRERKRAIGVVGRVEELATGRQLIDTALTEFGRVDYLINNAGIVADRMTHHMSEEEWDMVMNVHAKGTFSCTQAFITHCKQTGHGGVVINMISTAGLLGTVGQINYAAAKGAILAMTYTWAAECSRIGIRFHAVAPAALTDMTRPHVERAMQQATERGESLPDYWKIGTSEEVAEFVKWLITSEEKSGTVFGINGKRAVQWHKPEKSDYPGY